MTGSDSHEESVLHEKLNVLPERQLHAAETRCYHPSGWIEGRCLACHGEADSGREPRADEDFRNYMRILA
ncbi:hypothetical protein WK25_20435 [Burkholderia latens]|nr:hypothetical protein WK25_20435 [Burkholderia latens]